MSFLSAIYLSSASVFSLFLYVFSSVFVCVRLDVFVLSVLPDFRWVI